MSIKNKISAWIIAIIVLLGGIVSALIMHGERHVIEDRFIESRRASGDLLSRVLSDDVMIGDYYSARVQMAAYLQYEGVERAAICLSNGEVIVVGNIDGFDRRLCENPSDVFNDVGYAVAAPIKYDDAVFGRVVVEYPVDELAMQLSSMRRSIIISYAAITAIAVVMLIVAVGYAMRPIIACIEWIKSYIRDGTCDALSRSEVEAARSKEERDLKEVFLAVIDEFKKAHDRRKEESMMAAIGQMSSHIAHDMRSPLAVLQAYLNMQLNGDGKNQSEYNAAARRSAEKLLHMADDLVDYAKAIKLQKESVLFKRMYENCIKFEVTDTIEKEIIKLNIDIADDLCVSIDRYRMARVITNMIHNAIRAVKGGEGRIEMIVDVDNEKDIMILVKDNGCGIREKDLPHIFENFFSTDRKKGTGLGLSYCKQVVEAHGGTIDVESEVGKGTTFTIRIPNCVVSEAEAKACRNEPQLKIEGRKFLLIDDDADIRLRWRRIVEEGGGTVVGEADSPEKACGVGIDMSAADAAIVDYNFEGSEKTGLDVIAHLKTRGLREIHMCTGFAHDDTIRRAAMAAGADSVIQKV
ncbi:MAG: hybrid sensor histidine kinase/response regulator [Proteobacteria bacterium]|nr:hybrid sensor histidine kinase/response regulator [Pseudomonadota bacterium]